MIVVSGAAGKTGQAVIRALVERGATVRAFVRQAQHSAVAREAGAAEVAVGDMLDEAAFIAATSGCEAVYHIAPNVHPQEVAICKTAIRAAKESGVGRFVYHSVLHPAVEAMPHHWLKMRVEEMLFESGLAFTILQPAAYMQNALAHKERVMGEGVYGVPYPVATRMSPVDLRDVAEAAAIVLTEDGHGEAIYELAGPEALSQEEIGQIWGRATGREVKAVEVPLETWEADARRGRMSDYAIETLLAMFRYYAAHGFRGNPNVLRWVLGREPTTFESFVNEIMGSGA